MSTCQLAPRFNWSRIFVLLFVSCTALAAATLIAQTTAPPAAPVPQAATSAKPILFEVVSIRPVKSDVVYGKGYTADGYSMRGISVWSLVTYYLENQSDRMDKLPDWARNDQYDIEAKVADADVAAWGKLQYSQKVFAIHAMMEDRFKLKVHRETRQFPGYALVVAKNGPKFKQATPGDTYAKGAKTLDGSPLLGSMMEIRSGVVVGQAISMVNLASFLSMPAQRPVLDKTGLTGVYDVTLKFDPFGPQPPPASSADGVAAAPEPAPASIFTMVQEQLGLKLESGATVPVEFLVVDHVERPTEN